LTAPKLRKAVDFKEFKHLQVLISRSLSSANNYCVENLYNLRLVNAKLWKVVERAFVNCYSVKFVDLKKVKLINTCSFFNCHSLMLNEINATQIKEKAFGNCFSISKLKAFKLETCGVDAFLNCDLRLFVNEYACLELVDVEVVKG